MTAAQTHSDEIPSARLVKSDKPITVGLSLIANLAFASLEQSGAETDAPGTEML